MDVLCKKCDIYVGYAGAGAAKMPDDKTADWLATHCWSCERHIDEVAANPRDTKQPSTALTNYVDKAMYEQPGMSVEAMERPIVHLLSATPDPLGSLAAACLIYEGRAIKSLDEITDDERRFYLNDVMNTTLQAPLEDIDFHFMVEGLTRASWDQMVRQRTANFGGESLRFSVKLPLRSVVRPGPSINNVKRMDLHDNAVSAIEAAYAALIDDGVPAEDARGLIPLNVLVQGHWKTNLRNMMTEIGKRTCTQAQWEWRMILLSMRDAIAKFPGYVQVPSDTQATYEGSKIEVIPTGWQFKYLAKFERLWQPICFKTGQCMFKAKADRGCTIRERVEAGQFDRIDPREYMLDPQAAWVR